MSNAVFPTLTGITYPEDRTPIWDTIVQPNVSGKEMRLAQQTYPRYQWDLIFSGLRQGTVNNAAYTELAQLMGFYNARQGSFDSFLFTDPVDNAVTGQPIGTGDGSTTAFQLVRTFGGNVEPVLAPNTVSNVYVNGVAQYNGNAAFSRASSATYVNSSGTVATASTNVERFTYNPTTLASLGLLLEGAATNICLYSQTFTNASWVATNCTIAGAAAAAPDSTTTAAKFTDSSDGSPQSHLLVQTFTKAASAIQYTASFWVKDAGYGSGGYLYFELDGGSSGDGVQMVLNPNTGVINSAASVVGSFTSPSGTITSYANGWYRVTMTATSDTTTTLRFRIFSSNTASPGSVGYTGTGVARFYLWGAQVETGASATSYILTTSASASRAADVTSIPSGQSAASLVAPWTVANWGTSTPGLVTFQTAPVNTAAITADMTYYFPVRFVDDKINFSQMVSNIYEAKKISLMSVKN